MILWIINEQSALGRQFSLGAISALEWLSGLALVAAGQVRDPHIRTIKEKTT